MTSSCMQQGHSFSDVTPLPTPTPAPCCLFLARQMASSAGSGTAICVSVSVWWCVGVYLEASIVRAAFEYSLREDVSLSGFLGDDCVTLKHTPELQVQPAVERCFVLRAKLAQSYCPLEAWDRHMLTQMLLTHCCSCCCLGWLLLLDGSESKLCRLIWQLCPVLRYTCACKANMQCWNDTQSTP